MEKTSFEILTIGLEPRGIAVSLKMPRFAEEETEACKKDMAELKKMTSNLGHKIGDMLETYSPKHKAPNDLDKALGQVLEALHAVLCGDE